jgi:FTR1 family protein
MAQALALTFREGIGAFMVVAVLLALLARAHDSLVKPVQWGVVASIGVSIGAAALFAGADNQALWEGVLALLGAASVAWLIVACRRIGRHPGVRHGRLATVTAFLVTVLLISRAGMEIALLLGTLIAQVPDSDVLFGAQCGVALAIAMAWVWSRLARRASSLEIGRVGTAFLVVLFIHLLVDGVHEVAEAHVWPGMEGLHLVTGPYSSDGVFGQFAPYVLLALLLLWLLVAIFFGDGKASTCGVTHMDA